MSMRPVQYTHLHKTLKGTAANNDPLNSVSEKVKYGQEKFV